MKKILILLISTLSFSGMHAQQNDISETYKEQIRKVYQLLEEGILTEEQAQQDIEEIKSSAKSEMKARIRRDEVVKHSAKEAVVFWVQLEDAEDEERSQAVIKYDTLYADSIDAKLEVFKQSAIKDFSNGGEVNARAGYYLRGRSYLLFEKVDEMILASGVTQIQKQDKQKSSLTEDIYLIRIWVKGKGEKGKYTYEETREMTKLEAGKRINKMREEVRQKVTDEKDPNAGKIKSGMDVIHKVTEPQLTKQQLEDTGLYHVKIKVKGEGYKGWLSQNRYYENRSKEDTLTLAQADSTLKAMRVIVHNNLRKRKVKPQSISISDDLDIIARVNLESKEGAGIAKDDGDKVKIKKGQSTYISLESKKRNESYRLMASLGLGLSWLVNENGSLYQPAQNSFWNYSSQVGFRFEWQFARPLFLSLGVNYVNQRFNSQENHYYVQTADETRFEAFPNNEELHRSNMSMDFIDGQFGLGVNFGKKYFIKGLEIGAFGGTHLLTTQRLRYGTRELRFNERQRGSFNQQTYRYGAYIDFKMGDGWSHRFYSTLNQVFSPGMADQNFIAGYMLILNF
ncbi:MAG: hypothetical protein JJU02_14250 [Cryomorphaceae bacterium]|nr:hypothetical protein [Cryomorphaceae bacterium]